MLVAVATMMACAGLLFLQAEDGIRDLTVTGVQTCALPIYQTCVLGHLGKPRRGTRVTGPSVDAGGGPSVFQSLARPVAAGRTHQGAARRARAQDRKSVV